MPEYSVKVKVDQIVTKEVVLLVVADSHEEAEDKSRQVVQVYPDPHEVEGVKRAITTKLKYWIPRDVNIVENKEA